MDSYSPLSAQSAISKIRHTYSTATLDAQSDYIHRHASSYTADEVNQILNEIEKQRAKLNPEPTDYNCARISEIEVIYTPEGNGFLISPQSRTHNLQKYCELARQSGKHLSEYIITELEAGQPLEYVDIRYKFATPTAAIQGLEEEENMVQMQGAPTEQKPSNEARINLDVIDIFRRLEQRIMELEERIEVGASRQEIDALRKQIADLERQRDEFEKRYHDILSTYEREKTTKTYETTLTAKEYGIFQTKYSEYLPGLRPYTFHKAGEGYEIRIDYQTKEQEDAITHFLTMVHTEGRPSARGVNPMTNTRMVDQLCRAFERQTGKKCGISRGGAITTLAEMISNYMHQISERYAGRHEFDMSSIEGRLSEIDLFARPGQSVYTVEQAQEAFSMFVRGLENRLMEERGPTHIHEEFTEQDLCDPSVMYPNFLDVYVYLQKKEKHTDTPEDKQRYDRALADLQGCGYNPSRYREFLQGTEAFFDDMGQNFYTLAEDMGA